MTKENGNNNVFNEGMGYSFIAPKSVIACACGCGFEPQKSALWFLYSLSREYNKHFQKNLLVTSGARCYEHNAAVGGKPNSAHTVGLAFDVAFANSRECFVLVRHLYNMGIRRLGINFAKMFIHFDIDPTLPQDVLFKY